MRRADRIGERDGNRRGWLGIGMVRGWGRAFGGGGGGICIHEIRVVGS